jgi:hypothetical protein
LLAKQPLRDEGSHGLELCPHGWRPEGLVWVRHYRD